MGVTGQRQLRSSPSGKHKRACGGGSKEMRRDEKRAEGNLGSREKGGVQKPGKDGGGVITSETKERSGE